MAQLYSEAVRQALTAPHRRHSFPTTGPAGSPGSPIIIHQHFSVVNEPVALQALAWRDYVDRILDVPLTRSQVAGGFKGELDTYVLKDMIYLDSRTDPVTQARTAARISTDGMRDYVFHVAAHGIIDTATGKSQRKSTQFVPGILALDMNQTMRMQRPTPSRVLAFFLPRAVVESVIPEAEAMHGRVVGYTSPLTRLLLGHLDTLSRRLPEMTAAEADTMLHGCAQLILAVFGKQSRLSAGARAAARAAMFSQVQEHVQANLHQKDLSPESILRAFRWPRPTLYRMFEHEGGLATYIRNCRLREAADELVRLPRMGITEIGYGLGFGSASDFSRAFRRNYGMTPQDFRAVGLADRMGSAHADEERTAVE